MMEPIRWGILGTGKIAAQFAADLALIPDARLHAIGSRTDASASAFARQFSVPKAYSTYLELVQDSEVDVVYIATPHPFHRENSLLCLEHGKHVLCEKPFALNAAEAEQIIATAQEHQLFLMEAMWTRFLPAVARLRGTLQQSPIGDIRMLMADFGFLAEYNPEGRLFNPDLGGGSLLDLGVYPVSFSSMLFGVPEDIEGVAQIGETGVDEQGGVVLRHSSGSLSVLASSLMANTPCNATIIGTSGSIVIPRFWQADEYSVYRPAVVPETVKAPRSGNGYQYEAMEVIRCIREGRLESPIMPLQESLQIMQTLDRIRAKWELKYPGENCSP